MAWLKSGDKVTWMSKEPGVFGAPGTPKEVIVTHVSICGDDADDALEVAKVPWDLVEKASTNVVVDFKGSGYERWDYAVRIKRIESDEIASDETADAVDKLLNAGE